jgi:glycerol-3-phosphate acyltransferase PlsY
MVQTGGKYMENGLILLLGYAFGCIQAAYLLGRFVKKTDIRTHGSKNSGASNATMTFGWKMGATVALVDILKAVVAILIIGLIFDLAHSDLEWKYLAGGGVILGHDFPFFMGFRGGKGTASLVGVMAMIDWKMALVGILAIVLITVLTDYIVFGTYAMLAVFVGFTVFLTMEFGPIGIALGLSLLSVWLHRKNIGKIMRGEERGLRSVIRKNSR